MSGDVITINSDVFDLGYTEAEHKILTLGYFLPIDITRIPARTVKDLLDCWEWGAGYLACVSMTERMSKGQLI